MRGLFRCCERGLGGPAVRVERPQRGEDERPGRRARMSPGSGVSPPAVAKKVRASQRVTDLPWAATPSSAPIAESGRLLLFVAQNGQEHRSTRSERTGQVATIRGRKAAVIASEPTCSCPAAPQYLCKAIAVKLAEHVDSEDRRQRGSDTTLR